MSTSRTAVGLVVAAGLLLGGGIAAGTLAATGALAASTSPSPSASGSPGVPGDGHGRQLGDGDGDGPRRAYGMGRGHRGPGMLGALGQGRLLHGEVVVAKPGGGTETLLVQHGTVTAQTSDGVTVRSSDGFTVTWKVTGDTKILAGRASSTLADVAKDADVMVVGPTSSGGATARMLGVRPTGTDGTRPDDRHGPGTTPSPSPTTSSAVLTG